MELLQNSGRGVWSLTEGGRTVTENEILPMYREYSRAARRRRNGVTASGPDSNDANVIEEHDDQLTNIVSYP